MADDNTGLPPSEHWLQTYWRPAMAWSYLVICVCDFIVFPAVTAALYSSHGATIQEWHPITLEGGGLYHVAMGAIVGVTSWQRTREKMAQFQNGDNDRH